MTESHSFLGNVFGRTAFFIGVMLLFSLSLLVLSVFLQANIDASTSLDHLFSVTLVPYLCGSFILSGIGLILSRIFKSLLTPSWLLAFMATSFGFSMLGMATWESYKVLDEGHIGLNNLYQVSVLLLSFLGAFGLWFDLRMRFRGLALFNGVVFIAGSAFIIWLYVIGEAGPRELVPALRSYWLPWHVLANFVGYGAFMVAAGGGVLELMRMRADHLNKQTALPSQKECRYMSLTAVKFGFPVFTLATILGSLWAYDSWGGYWSWDPKETWALIVWLVYAGYLHAAFTPFKYGKVMPIWAILGFFVTLFCYLGVNMFLDGLHSYGQLG